MLTANQDRLADVLRKFAQTLPSSGGEMLLLVDCSGPFNSEQLSQYRAEANAVKQDVRHCARTFPLKLH